MCALTRSQLDIDSKKWRIRADVLNDIAMAVEILVLPQYLPYSTYILCATTAVKAIVGVAGGATRSALTQHHAVRGNLADVSSKDNSQETAVNLLASFVGLYLLTSIENRTLVFYPTGEQNASTVTGKKTIFTFFFFHFCCSTLTPHLLPIPAYFSAFSS